MKLVDVIRKARKTYRDSMNKIEAIRVIREARPGRDLFAAKTFWEWIDTKAELSATELAHQWCEQHWGEREFCGCTVAQAVSQSSAAGARAPSATADSEAIAKKGRDNDTAKPQPSGSALIEANKDRCPCGRKPCADEFHAKFAALVRKHGNSRAVELTRIASGIKAPENEEQARFVEAQPGYKPFYKELQQ